MRRGVMRQLGMALFAAGLWFSLAGAAKAKEIVPRDSAPIQTVQYYYGPGYYGGYYGPGYSGAYYGPRGYYGHGYYGRGYGYWGGRRFYGGSGYYRGYGYRHR